MAQVQFEFSDLKELISISQEEAIEALTMLGFPTEVRPDGSLDVEVTPNRPDALCVEGLARVLRCYRTKKSAKYVPGRAKVGVAVDASVGAVRPYFGGAIVRKIRMTGALVRSIMQVQEKLHDTLGRKRRKVAIGIHDLDRVKPPFRYYACKRDCPPFVPLEAHKKMTPGEILQTHPKGREYAHLVGEMCPMIIDSEGEVLSFPPIINGERTKLTGSTKNLFIDCTGTSSTAVKQTVNILAAMLADRGGRIEEISVNGRRYALLEETKWKLPVAKSEKLLGVKLGKARVASLLSKMGHRQSGGSVFVPGYRVDVLDDVDLVEDVAIAYGFNNFKPSLPNFASIGKVDAEPSCHEILLGLGFDEALTWHLSNKGLEERAGLEEGQAAEIENPLTSDFSTFRRALLPNLLSVLSESKNEKLPIRIYEVGPVASPDLERRLALASMHPRASFSEIKGTVLALFNAEGKKAEIVPAESSRFIAGRCAKIMLDGKDVGHLGEISPKVLSSFGLEQPVCAAEISV